MDLRTGMYKPYTTENGAPVYVHCKSNHPPTVLKSIPTGVNRRLSKISATKEIFNAAIPPFQEALSKSGYNHTLCSLNHQKNELQKRRIEGVLLPGSIPHSH